MTDLERRVHELEKWRGEQDALMRGSLKENGVLGTLLRLVETIHGIDGTGGLKKVCEDNRAEIQRAKAWMAGASFVGSLVGGAAVWALNHYIK